MNDCKAIRAEGLQVAGSSPASPNRSPTDCILKIVLYVSIIHLAMNEFYTI